MRIPDINVPLCPTCGDPVTSGCYPADGICAVADDEQSRPAVGDTVGSLRVTLAQAEANGWAGWLCCEHHNNRSNGLPCDGACCDECPGLGSTDTRPLRSDKHRCEQPAKCWADPDCPVYSSRGASGQPTTTTAPYSSEADRG